MVAQNGQPEWSYTVTMRPDEDQKGQLRVRWTQDGVDGSVGSSVDPANSRATWGFGDDSPFVLGLVPDETAKSVTMSTHGDCGLDISTIAPIPGTTWSAFALAFDKPLTGYDPVATMLWIDHLGRPVDQDGNRGTVTTLAAASIWRTSDGSVLGVERQDARGSFSGHTPFRGEAGSSSTYPHTVMARQGDGGSHMVLRLRPDAARAVRGSLPTCQRERATAPRTRPESPSWAPRWRWSAP